MDMRRHISSAIKLSSALNTIAAYERGAAPSAALILKKSSQHYHYNRISSIPFQTPSSKLNPKLISSSDNFFGKSERETVGKEYQCPSRLAHKLSQMVILDKQTNKSDYHLPLATTIISSLIDPRHNETSEIKDPTPYQMPVKHAKIIMRIRHKKMKKHKLKKLRKRMYFVWRKQKLVRKAKRDAVFWKEVQAIKKDGEDFDAETFVKSQLEKARRGGFYRNVFESKV